MATMFVLSVVDLYKLLQTEHEMCHEKQTFTLETRRSECFVLSQYGSFSKSVHKGGARVCGRPPPPPPGK